MSDNLIIEENTIYEIDPQCVKLKKQCKDASQTPNSRKGKKLSKQSINNNPLFFAFTVLCILSYRMF